MLRLTDYGVAMHLGYVPNYPASHGCIRLENGFAQKMYYWADIGTPVLIRGYPPRRIDRPIARTASRIVSSGNSDRNRIFTGNDPLKLLSTIPGKKESAGSGRNPPKKKMRSDRKRYIATGVEKKPVSPLAMLKE
jgi:lipoprotein-anchoring transpeptidase ErfK/SrfK